MLERGEEPGARRAQVHRPRPVSPERPPPRAAPRSAAARPPWWSPRSRGRPASASIPRAVERLARRRPPRGRSAAPPRRPRGARGTAGRRLFDPAGLHAEPRPHRQALSRTAAGTAIPMPATRRPAEPARGGARARLCTRSLKHRCCLARPGQHRRPARSVSRTAPRPALAQRAHACRPSAPGWVRAGHHGPTPAASSGAPP